MEHKSMNNLYGEMQQKEPYPEGWVRGKNIN